MPRSPRRRVPSDAVVTDNSWDRGQTRQQKQLLNRVFGEVVLGLTSSCRCEQSLDVDRIDVKSLYRPKPLQHYQCGRQPVRSLAREVRGGSFPALSRQRLLQGGVGR